MSESKTEFFRRIVGMDPSGDIYDDDAALHAALTKRFDESIAQCKILASESYVKRDKKTFQLMKMCLAEHERNKAAMRPPTPRPDPTT